MKTIALIVVVSCVVVFVVLVFTVVEDICQRWVHFEHSVHSLSKLKALSPYPYRESASVF